MKGDREKYLMAGLDGYVSKPIRTDVLRDEIARVVQFAEIRFQSNEGTPMEKQNSNSLDREELLNRVEHDEELAREILGIFQTDSAANRDSLRAAVESRNADEVRSLAHGFKGMLANLAANSASVAAGNLETLGKEGKANEFASAWQAFDNELSNVLKEVEQMLAGAIQ
jgi:HPt (histidine-containing phosphotransfer) domain-containing protein